MLHFELEFGLASGVGKDAIMPTVKARITHLLKRAQKEKRTPKGYSSIRQVARLVRPVELALKAGHQAQYQLYNSMSQSLWAMRGSDSAERQNLGKIGSRVISDLRSQRFSILKDDQHGSIAKELLAHVFEAIDSEWRQPSRLVTRVSMEGYSFNDGPLTRNIVYVSKFSAVQLTAIRNYLTETGLKDTVENYFSSAAGVCNVRAYRLTGGPDTKNQHIGENFHSIEEVPAHYDGLPEDGGLALKIMIFRDGKDDLVPVSRQHGALEVKVGERWESVSGAPYVAAVLEANFLWHRAPRPDQGMLRDAIEITLIPRLTDDFPIISSGAQTGAPLNPFEAWDKPLGS